MGLCQAPRLDVMTRNRQPPRPVVDKGLFPAHRGHVLSAHGNSGRRLHSQHDQRRCLVVLPRRNPWGPNLSRFRTPCPGNPWPLGSVAHKTEPRRHSHATAGAHRGRHRPRHPDCYRGGPPDSGSSRGTDSPNHRALVAATCDTPPARALRARRARRYP